LTWGGRAAASAHRSGCATGGREAGCHPGGSNRAQAEGPGRAAVGCSAQIGGQFPWNWPPI